MGCDIHMLTEYRKKIREKEEWVNADHFSYNPYFKEGSKDGERKMNLEPIYHDRNYNLFARLAGVRKYNDEIPTISEPKGLPNDVSQITKEYSDDYGSDGHSHSWLTYKELEDFRNQKCYDSASIELLLDKMEERMKDVFWIYRNDSATNEQKEGFRIVFFFDN